MSRIIVTMFVALDGGTDEPQKWTFPYGNDEIWKFKHAELFGVGALLLGRKTYDTFAAAWPTRKNDDYADRMNSLPKYVVSTTLGEAGWNNSTVIRSNVVPEIKALKEKADQDLLVFGSITLVDTLRQHDLVDEYRLLVYPILLGAGKRMFQDGNETKLQLKESRSFETGVVLVRYGRGT